MLKIIEIRPIYKITLVIFLTDDIIIPVRARSTASELHAKKKILIACHLIKEFVRIACQCHTS